MMHIVYSNHSNCSAVQSIQCDTRLDSISRRKITLHSIRRERMMHCSTLIHHGRISLRSTLVLVLTLSLSFPPGLSARFRKTGTVGYSFLKIPVTARHTALGESMGSITDNAGITPLFLNPAVLGFQTHKTVGCSYSTWIADINHQAGGVTSNLGYFGIIGIGINYLDYGEFTRTAHGANLGEYLVTGTYQAQALAIGLTYARRLTDRFAYGLRLNHVRETIAEYTSTNFLLDMGVIYFTGWRSLRIGGFINNFGVDEKYIGDSFKMPTELHLSLTYDLFDITHHKLTLTSELSHPSDNLEKIHVGVEYQLYRTIFLRGGYKFQTDEDHFAFGGGILWQGFLLDLAVTPFGRFPTIYHLTLQKEF